MAINPSFYVLLVLLFSLGNSADATVFTIVNRCNYTVWPGTLAASGSATLGEGGFTLATGASIQLTAPPGWSGRFWGRTGCTFDAASIQLTASPWSGRFGGRTSCTFDGAGNVKCLTGDCGGLKCAGSGATPATLLEFTIAMESTANDFYDVSLVDGYNVGMGVTPTGGNGNDCQYAGCTQDLNAICPLELQVKDPASNTVVACKSACAAFNQPQYCCTGANNTPETCKPTNYSQNFKTACPSAYSYAYDDLSSTHTCAGANYEITLCPS